MSTILVIGTVLLTVGAVGLMENLILNKRQEPKTWTVEEEIPVVDVKEV